MSIFFTFFRTSFFTSKKHLFLSRRSINVSFWVCLLRKKHIRKRSVFDKNHGVTPLENVDFLEFFRTFLLWSKNHSFLSRIWKNVSFWLFLLKKNIWEKGRFFDKNHGLNPLQNVDFFDFFRTSLFRFKKHSLLSRIWKNVFFGFFWPKKTYEKKVDFLTKTMN